MLLRRYDRESKVNKRLSMDNEELAYRLSQGETGGSPDIMRRSISHSPTNSETGGPTVVRRRSPLPPPLSPRSPRSPAISMDFSPRGYNNSGVFNTNGNANTEDSLSPPKGGLKRSGTYELLDKKFNEEDSSEGSSENDSRHSNT